MFLPGLSGTTTRVTATSSMAVSACAGRCDRLSLAVSHVLELHHDLDSLLLAHRAHTEQRGDVDEADAANLHVVRGQLVTPPDEDVVAAPGHLYHVVGHEPVPPLHQVEHAFALSDSRAAHEQQPDAVDVGEGAVQRGAGSECLLDDRLDLAVELGRLELGCAAPARRCPGRIRAARPALPGLW